MNDKQRAEFEKWFPKELEDKAGVKSLMWHVWQAAIASVVVELPTMIIDEYDNGDVLEYVEMSELKDALTNAGVKYK